MHQVKYKVNFALLSLVDGTLEPLLWDTSVQGTPPQNLVLKKMFTQSLYLLPLFLGHLCSRDTSSKFGPEKNVHTIFVFVTSVLGTPLFRGRGHCFWVPKPRFNLHSRDILAITKIVDKIKCWLVTMATAFKTWTTGISLKIYILHLWEFNTQHCRDKLIIFSVCKESGVW